PTYQAYSGPAKSAAEVASVFIPREFNLLNVNGESYTQPLVGNGIVAKFLPGSHKIVIKYVDFWDVSSDMTDRVASQPILLEFSAKAGENYRITSQELNDVKSAKSFAKNPEVDIIEEKNKTSVATDIKYQLEDKGLIAAFVDSLSSNGSSTDDTTTPTSIEPSNEQTRSKGEPALEMLKYWWQKADAQQQEDFMKWVVEK
ncbi:DUF2057 family protein, partial [Kaarinaea lacus]